MSSDKDRLSRYGKAIWETSRADEGTISFIGANIVARAVMAVADDEQAVLRAEVERLKAELSRARDMCARPAGVCMKALP